MLTSNEVQAILFRRNWEKEYPLFTTVNRIVNQQLPASAVVGYRDAALLPMHSSADHQSSDDLRSLALASSAQMEA